MKLFAAAVFCLMSLAAADVSHLSNTYLPPAQQQQQSFSGPSYQQSFHSSGSSAGLSALSNEYLPPVQHSHSGPAQTFSSGHVDQTYAVPVQTYSAPAAQSYSSSVSYSGPAVQQSYSGPSSDYLPPVQQSYSLPASVHHTYSAPAVSYSNAAAQSYSAAAVQSYSVPAVQSYAAPSVSYATSSADVGTQYAANGGYVYRKK